ncbi:molybdopterin-dependent oxidoreductase [Actinomadura barringtoniae]|uniref:Molybdopterin-dependent oxidoreductase n=1 Tax=Actinomadura barringtoniae TaxID=1427535 RepID=A0A939P8S4_9ACTN|nr:molybdopterin cofactor-binding domain-containing protein [Actinomadura barringtoniae]MBO2447497.1 molybdopterin-dependent oxidoreductase [Actinomadura barringtoniae]
MTTRRREPTSAPDGVGASAQRPDGEAKVRGAFEYSSDLWREGMLWGATLRSPHPHALIRRLDTTAALAVQGVHAVLTHEDVPGSKTYGMKVSDQPVLADGVVRHQGEPVAVVAAEDPETARRALSLVEVEYEVLEPLTDPEEAVTTGSVVRHVKIRHGDLAAARERAEVVVAGDYEVGMQDQAFLGPESGMAVPDGDGGVDLYVSSQWLHEDQRQVASSLGLPKGKVRLTMSGVGGAFGGREDLSFHIHACMLALRTGRPVKMSYNREESFFGHVHRHPAQMRIEHGATRDGRIVYMTARLVLDGGAYTSTSQVVIANACYFAAGAYEVPHAQIDGYAVFTNNPPCGAMRGFGAVQSCYAVESNMDRLARELGMDPLRLRVRNAMSPGTILPTGQEVDGPAPVAELLERLAAMPMPDDPGHHRDPRSWPGGLGNVTRGESLRRGVGYAVGVKAIGYSGGVEDYCTARVTVTIRDGRPHAEVYCAASECGQGVVTVQAQVVRTELGVEDVEVRNADTLIGDSGSSSASRQTWMTAGAVQGACRALAARVPDFALLSEGEQVSETFEYHHRPTRRIDVETGQGDAHIAFAFAAHRAVVEVDTELGLVRVLELATTEDVGKAINPRAVEGQIEGGSAQGLGLALMEEVQVTGGVVRNPSFTDYLIPTILDMPPVRIELLELPHPDSPYGLNGVGEPPTLSSTPAIVNALRDATGLDLPRVPVRPDTLAGLEEVTGS